MSNNDMEEKLRRFIEMWQGDGVVSCTPPWAKYIENLLDKEE